MSDYFDRVEAHLLDAVERHATRRTVRWSPVPGNRNAGSRARVFNTSTMLAAAAVVASLSVAGVFLASVHQAKRAPHGSAATSQACGAAGARRLSRGSPPKSLLSILAVLRRPQTPQDHPPPRFERRGFGGGRHVLLPPVAVRRQHGVPSTTQLSHYGSVYEYSRYVRRARVFAGGSDYLIPVAAAADVAGSSQCSRPYFAGLALYQLRYGAGSGGCCISASAILAGHAGGTSSSGGQTIVTSVVPDRFASVTLHFTAGSAPASPLQPSGKRSPPGTRATVTTSPVGNVVAVIVPAGIADTAFTVRPVWRSASGQIINPIR
jgi:hypothetical protein